MRTAQKRKAEGAWLLPSVGIAKGSSWTRRKGISQDNVD
jgi:hypothetical protein